MEYLQKLIEQVAITPSFSSFEECIHPLLRQQVASIPGARWHDVPANNVVISVSGRQDTAPVALAAHLDKINHFGWPHPDRLPFKHHEDRMEGQLDDAVGVALCLTIARWVTGRSGPPLLLLFSEMEESTGLREHPHLLKNRGEGLYHGMGADRIADFLLENEMMPGAVITLDTTPLFKGASGVALYAGHWDFTGNQPGKRELDATDRLVETLSAIDPDLKHSNNTNDYLNYGRKLNGSVDRGIPSVAVEPAIHPYHCIGEQVYYRDLERVYHMVTTYLSASQQPRR